MMREIPDLSFETIKRMKDMSWFTYAQIFDDLLIVAQKETCCYIWNTSKGLVIFDGIWPDERVYKAIIQAIVKIGWDNKRLAAFIITHGHIDHVGCGKWLMDNNDVMTYLSKQDDILRIRTSHEEGYPDCWKTFPISKYISDGDVLNFGDKSVRVLATPGHTSGCMSFIFPVVENDKMHIASLFGGATAPWNDKAAQKIQLESIEKFKSAAKKYHSDVALTNHTAFDNGLERIAYSKKRMCYLPNIYIIGESGVQQFCDVYRKIAE